MRAFTLIALGLMVGALFIPVASADIIIKDQAACKLLVDKQIPVPFTGIGPIDSGNVDLSHLRETCQRNAPIAVGGVTMNPGVDAGLIVID